MKLFLAEGSTPVTRVLVTLSRGYGTAVERNRARRVGKELFRMHKHSLAPGVDLLFLFYPGEFQYHDRERQMLGLLQRANVLAP